MLLSVCSVAWQFEAGFESLTGGGGVQMLLIRKIICRIVGHDEHVTFDYKTGYWWRDCHRCGKPLERGGPEHQRYRL